MKNSLFFFSLFITIGLQGQSMEVQGKVQDAASDEMLPGAHVSLMYPWDEVVQSTVSDVFGSFTFSKVEKGGYKIKVSFLGYADFIKEITLTNQSIDLGALKISEDAVNLDAVVVKEKLPLAQQYGDTTAYNANAFKTLKDASAEELISKMPGVISNNGHLQVQGENVGKVLVDGKEYFGDDPSAALKNLPAEVISKIQVFDQASDQAQFTGFDDGNTVKTINIITKNGMSNAQFGKLYAGFGLDEKYQIGGNTSFFDGDRRISIIGQSNNINVQNFASQDLLGVLGSNKRRGRRGGGRRGGRGGSSTDDFTVPQSGGIASTHAFGLNYSDKLGEKLNISGSYFFNNTENISEEKRLTEYIDNEAQGETYEEESNAKSDNFNHRFSSVIEYRFSDRTSIKMRPKVSFQENEGFSNTFAQTLLGEIFLNSTQTDYRTNLKAIKASNNLLLRHRFARRGRTISANISTAYDNHKGDNYLNSENNIKRSEIISDTLNQLGNLDVDGWTHSADISYTEPVGKGMMMFTYKASLQEEASDKRTYDYSTEHQAYDLFNESLSSVFNNEYWTHQVGTGYNFRKGREFFGLVRLNAQWSNLTSDEVFPLTLQIKRNYFNVVPFAMLRLDLSKQEKLRFMYRSNTQSPTVQQLQNVVDNNNPLQLSVGNPDLDQSFNHRFFIRYTKSNIEKASIFFLMLNGNFTQNYIGNATYLAESDHPIFNTLNVQRGTQLSQPTNLNGYRNVRVFSTYGFPFKLIKTNINIDLAADYVRIPGLINDDLNYSTNQTLTTGLTFASNVSEYVDFTISSRTAFNKVKNSLQSAGNTNYLSQKTKLKLACILPGNIIYRTNFSHQFYDGLSGDLDQGYFLWNMSVGIKFLKEKRGELALSIVDLLNQNQSITRNITDVYIEDLQTNVLQRYLMLKFTYNLRNINTGKVQSEKQKERRRWEKF